MNNNLCTHRSYGTFLATLGIAVLAFTGCGRETTADFKVADRSMAIYGQWGDFLDVTQEGLRLRLQLRFSPDLITGVNICEYEGRKIVVEVSAKAKITASEVTVLESKLAEKKEGGFTCTANLRPAKFSYRILSGGRLELSTAADGVKSAPRVN